MTDYQDMDVERRAIASELEDKGRIGVSIRNLPHIEQYDILPVVIWEGMKRADEHIREFINSYTDDVGVNLNVPYYAPVVTYSFEIHHNPTIRLITKVRITDEKKHVTEHSLEIMMQGSWITFDAVDTATKEKLEIMFYQCHASLGL